MTQWFTCCVAGFDLSNTHTHKHPDTVAHPCNASAPTVTQAAGGGESPHHPDLRGS